MAKKKSARKEGDERAGEVTSPEASTLGGHTFRPAARRHDRGTGHDAAGQSGDIQGLRRKELADSESVEELVEEGQFHEAEVVNSVENAPDPDQGEVHTHETPAPSPGKVPPPGKVPQLKKRRSASA